MDETISTQDLRDELERERTRRRRHSIFRRALAALVAIAAASMVVATFFVGIVQVRSTDMSPTLREGDVLVVQRTQNLQAGDIAVYDINGKIFVKRVIATQGDIVNITDEGDIYVNGTMLDEPYVDDAYIGSVTLRMPYTVPDNSVFVLGDNRATATDSRSIVVGSIRQDQLVGKVALRAWPLLQIGAV